jgi:hypothetical protein
MVTAGQRQRLGFIFHKRKEVTPGAHAARLETATNERPSFASGVSPNSHTK